VVSSIITPLRYLTDTALSEMATMANANQALGALDRLSPELRNMIYGLVMSKQDCQSGSTKLSDLPGKPPGLMFASREIYKETRTL